MIKVDGKLFRMRRGQLVEIPAEWRGNFTTPATIRQRPSKLIGKVKRAISSKACYVDAKFKHILNQD